MFTLMPYRPYLSRQPQKRMSLLNDPFFRNFMSNDDMMPANGFRVDIRDKGDIFLLEAELPGVEEQNINLSVEENVLTISADVNLERKDEKENYYYCERRSGHMSRSFSLDNIDQDGISAEYVNGILSVSLPKEKPAPEKTARKIEINPGKLAEGTSEVEAK